jgi:hypothetical protein
MSLVLHCGAEEISEDQLKKLNTPEGTRTHVPVPHYSLVQELEKQLDASDIEIVEAKHGLSKDEQRYFGMFKLESRHEVNGDVYNTMLGIRNAHDKAFLAQLSLGAYVMNCDNLSFHGDVIVGRKHTRYIKRDLPALFSNAFSQVMESEGQQAKRFGAYGEYEFDRQADVHDFIIRSVLNKVIPNSKIPYVLDEWANEKYEKATLWDMFNAYTEVLKSVGNLHEMPRRTKMLHGICDSLCGAILN